MMTVVSKEKCQCIEPEVAEVSVHVAVLEMVAWMNEKIKKKNKRLIRSNVQVAAGKIV